MLLNIFYLYGLDYWHIILHIPGQNGKHSFYRDGTGLTGHSCVETRRYAQAIHAGLPEVIVRGM